MIDFLKKNSYLLAGVVAGILIVTIFSQLVVGLKLSLAQNNMNEQIKETEKSLFELADQIATGARNDVALSIMPDCSSEDRSLFDNNLSRLDKGLSASELDDLDRVFNYCAPVYAIHRSAMTMQLNQKTTELEHLIKQRKFLGQYEDMDKDLAIWQDLIREEKNISKLSFDLVSLQKEIIEDLINGLDVNSKNASELKGRGQTIQVEMRASTKKATELRDTLLNT